MFGAFDFISSANIMIYQFNSRLGLAFVCLWVAYMWNKAPQPVHIPSREAFIGSAIYFRAPVSTSILIYHFYGVAQEWGMLMLRDVLAAGDSSVGFSPLNMIPCSVTVGSKT